MSFSLRTAAFSCRFSPFDAVKKLIECLEHLETVGHLQWATIAQQDSQRASLWRMREGIPEACSREGAVYKYDVSLPMEKNYQIIDLVRDRLEQRGFMGNGQVIDVVGYGHIGDGILLEFCWLYHDDFFAERFTPTGNVHLNVACKEYTPQVADALEPFVYEWIGEMVCMNLFFWSLGIPTDQSSFSKANHKGSISAEHGIGLAKAKYLQLNKTPEMLGLMKTLKGVMDPNGICNP